MNIYYRERRGVEGIAVHDACAVAYALAPELFETITGPIRAATDGISRGQTIIVPGDRQFPPSAWDEVRHSQGCVGIDAEGVLNLYEEVLLNRFG